MTEGAQYWHEMDIYKTDFKMTNRGIQEKVFKKGKPLVSEDAGCLLEETLCVNSLRLRGYDLGLFAHT